MLYDWRSRYYHCDSIVTCIRAKHVSPRTALYRQHRPQGFQLFSTKMYGAQAYVPRYGLADDADDYDDTQEELTKDSPWDLATLLQVVKSLLLFVLFIVGDLGSHLMTVVDQCLSLLFLDFLFLGLDLLLLLNLVHVVFSLNASLLGQTGLLFRELPLTSQLEVSLNSLSLLVLKSLSLSGLSLTLFESALGSKSIDFCLSISCLLLEFSQPLNFTFFFILNSLSFKLSFVLLLVLGFLVGDDRFFMSLLLLEALFLLKSGLSVGFGSLLH